ncbi:ATP-binding protein [Microbacterium sp. DT81.1]|uniref:sensor histidine kinase n=1 Tax=Microbacterium sp. DT81.1 TaxID=3393413 RepID=UPI003CF70B60
MVLLVGGLSGAASILLGALGNLALVGGSASAVALLLASVFLWPFFVVVPLALLPLVFPSGLLPGWLWRLFAALTGVAVLTLAVATVTDDTIPVGQGAPALANPFAKPELSLLLENTGRLLAVICFLAGLSALIVRFVRGSRLIRQQLALIGVAVSLMLAAMTLGPLLPNELFQTIMIIAPLLIFGSIAVAVLRYELYDIHVVVHRVALYSALTVSLTALFQIIYASVLALASQLPFTLNPWTAGALGAAVVVLCAEPVRRRLQGLLERRFLGERSRPLVAMAKLRDSMLELDDGAITDAITKTIADAVRSPRVDITLFGIDGREPSPGNPESQGDPLVVPLLHLQERIGELRIDRRSPREEYGPRDRELLSQLADQAAAILYGVRRDQELATARREAITTAAEERAQLGRDLHDGLGPLLAGAALTTEALRRGLEPGSQDELDAARLAERLRVAAGEIRRVAHDLQPAALPGGNLPIALTDYIDSLAGADVPQIELQVDTEALPEAVEQTAYFCVLEAVNNTIRHAKASSARVVVHEKEQVLAVEVTDDGVGMTTPYVSGVGLTSMRQRVQALGGTFSVSTPSTGGTTLTARIPVPT